MDILFTIRTTFSSRLVGHIAARLGECEKGITNALAGIVPLVLGGLINKAAAGGSEAIFELSQNAYRSTNASLSSVTGILGILGSGTAPGSGLQRGESLLITLFGTARQGMANSISDYACIKVNSAATLLSMVSAVLPAVLGQYAATYNLKARGVMETLLALKGKVRTMLPPGLYGLTCLAWLGGITAIPVAKNERGARVATVRLEVATVIHSVVHWWQGLLTLVRFA
ncbi:DUF937 domain-containing protein [Hymenobacter sp. BT664]|uniref:DUF937 domain-containing protein n=1 Tax=Hymenobacter montanus TaxID=2771359 RepID=A0A927BDD1_9BACT|nr:DUF937 domain-containing protein [Hymenobacter montanus]MBD2768044.1 DUF937 domain-containing protein [Hymenobacter montanus]